MLGFVSSSRQSRQNRIRDQCWSSNKSGVHNDSMAVLPRLPRWWYQSHCQHYSSHGRWYTAAREQLCLNNESFEMHMYHHEHCCIKYTQLFIIPPVHFICSGIFPLKGEFINYEQHCIKTGVTKKEVAQHAFFFVRFVFHRGNGPRIFGHCPPQGEVAKKLVCNGTSSTRDSVSHLLVNATSQRSLL